MSEFVIVVGDLTDGLWVYGPFSDEATARQWAVGLKYDADGEDQFEHWFLMPLHVPTANDADDC